VAIELMYQDLTDLWIDESSPPGQESSLLLKKAHLLRWPASALAATCFQYASLGLQPAALSELFEQRTRQRSIALENSADFRPDRGLLLGSP
jgi:hypothetical protein